MPNLCGLPWPLNEEPPLISGKNNKPESSPNTLPASHENKHTPSTITTPGASSHHQLPHGHDAYFRCGGCSRHGTATALLTREHPQSAQNPGHERPALLSRSRHQARGCGLCPDLEQKNLSNSPSISRLYTGKGFLGLISRPPASFYRSRKWIWPSPCGKATPPSRFLRQRHLGFLPKLCLWGSIAGV